MHIRLWAGMSVNTGKLRKYTRNFEFGGDKYNDSWSDSGKFTDK